MSAVAFGSVTFVCAFGCALLGAWLRTKLPETHLTRESHDVIRLGMGLVATMTALLLGLVTASAKGSYDTQDVAVRSAASGIITMDRLLARYGPETAPTRALLRQVVATRIEAVWSANGDQTSDFSQPGAVQARSPAEQIEDAILQLTPTTDSQRWFKTEALKLTEEVLRTRWRVLGYAGGSVPKPFLIVVIFWLSMTFGSFGLGAPRNATVFSVFAISAFSVAAAVFLILELDGPFEGVIRISSQSFRLVLSQLNR